MMLPVTFLFPIYFPFPRLQFFQVTFLFSISHSPFPRLQLFQATFLFSISHSPFPRLQLFQVTFLFPISHSPFSRLQLWRQHFVDLALIWMDVLARQINQWIVQAVAQDQVTFSNSVIVMRLLLVASGSATSCNYLCFLELCMYFGVITHTHSLTHTYTHTHTCTHSQWALLTFSIHHTDGSPTPALPQNLGVTSGIRQSPFPSPPISSREPSKITSSILGTTGAFTPYRRAVLTRYVEKSLHTPAVS